MGRETSVLILGCEVGLHAHNNLSLALASSLSAIDEGVNQVDGCLTSVGVIDRDGLMLGYSGVYGSFLLHAKRAAETARALLVDKKT